MTVAAIRQSPLLRGLTNEQLEILASEFETLELDGGEVIGVEGKLAEVLYVIQQGEVLLTRERYIDGEEFEEELGRL